MAIARGAGTEIIRSHFLEAVNSTSREALIGVQHHIYTILSIIINCQIAATDNNWIKMYLLGYDIVTGTTNRPMYLIQQDMSQYETFIWNDKFSFTGTEPTDFTATLDATKQDALADQGSSVPQKLIVNSEAAGDNFDVLITFIDQNNA